MNYKEGIKICSRLLYLWDVMYSHCSCLITRKLKTGEINVLACCFSIVLYLFYCLGQSSKCWTCFTSLLIFLNERTNICVLCFRLNKKTHQWIYTRARISLPRSRELWDSCNVWSRLGLHVTNEFYVVCTLITWMVDQLQEKLVSSFITWSTKTFWVIFPRLSYSVHISQCISFSWLMFI